MIRAFFFLFVAVVGALDIVAGSNYVGHWFVFLLFTLMANALLFNGFRRSALFFDTFIGIFFWLSFWLKTSVRVAFTDGTISEPVGAFNGSAGAFDQALLVSSCGFAALLVASGIRARLFVYPGIITFFIWGLLLARLSALAPDHAALSGVTLTPGKAGA